MAKTFIKGAAILGAAGVVTKILGFIFRIPLVSMISAQAMAFYNPAYYIYIFFVTLATSGIPIAVSRMVSERVTLDRYADANRVFKLSMRLMLGIGAVSFIIVFGGADIIAEMMENPGAAMPMRAISPCLIIIPVLAAFRGLFQGMQNMRPTAVSQIVEQLFRGTFGLVLAYILFSSAGNMFGISSKYIKGATGATFGGTAGAIGGLGIIFLIYMVNRDNFKSQIANGKEEGSEPNKSIYKEILIISVPITIGASIMPFINMIDAGLIITRLKSSGVSDTLAKSLYGGLTGMVNPMINFPHVITLAIATSLVPLIAGAYKEGNNELAESNIQLSGRTAMLIGMPCAVGFFVLAKPILQTLFYSQKVVMDEVSAAFMIMAVAVMFLASVQTLTSILQGVGKQMLPVRNMFIGVGVKILCTWFLVPVPSLGIKGAAIGTILAYTIATVLDTMAVTKYTGVSFEWKRVLLKPGISAVSMGVIVFGSYRLLIKLIGLAAISEHIQISMATMFSILVGIIIYYILIIVTQAVDKEDIMKLPKGEKLYNFAGRFIKQ